MDLYALVDDTGKVIRQRGKGKMGIFSDLGLLKQHAWRYGEFGVQYKVAKLVISEIIECDYIKKEDMK